MLLVVADRGIALGGRSGASAHVVGIRDALIRRGHRVQLAIAKGPATPGVTVVAPRRWSWLPRRVRERGESLDSSRLVAAALRDHPDPAWIWERHSLFAAGGAAAAARLRIPRVVELNAPLLMERDRVYNLDYARACTKRDLNTATRVVAVSAWLADWAVSVMGCAADRVVHVPNGTSHPLRGDRQRIREDLGLTGLVIGFVGAHRHWHGLTKIGQILDALPEATALIVGDGPAPPPSHPRIRRVGWVDDPHHYIAAFDVGIAPYSPDAPPWFCPLKVADYRAQGVPVASGYGQAGIDAMEVVTIDEPKEWAAAIRRLRALRTNPVVRTWDEVVMAALDGLDIRPS